MINNQDNISNELCEDVYQYVKDSAFTGKLNCFYHFDYEGISVEDLHKTMLYLYNKGFYVEFDVCAHIYVDWREATCNEALEFKNMAKLVQKRISKVEKKLYKNHFAMISSKNPFYENIKKYFELEEAEGMSYIKAENKEFLLVVEKDD